MFALRKYKGESFELSSFYQGNTKEYFRDPDFYEGNTKVEFPKCNLMTKKYKGMCEIRFY